MASKPEESETGDEGEGVVTRRSVVKSAALVTAGFGAIGGYTYFASQPVLASEGHEEWVAEGAQITTHDGSVDELTFGDTGDEADELHLAWSGLNADDRDVNFRILVKGDDDGDDDGWNDGNAGSETDYEELAIAEPGVTDLGSTNGSDDYIWEDVFGEEQPVDVDTHTEIDVTADFSEDQDGETRERVLSVDVEAWIDEEDGSHGPDGDSLGDRKTAEATITVTNEAAEIEVGGQGSFELTSAEEVE